jgi:hypothetical protein
VKASRSIPIRASSSHAVLIANSRDGNRPNGVLPGPDPVLDPGVRPVTQLEELQGPAAAWGVGDEHLMTQPGDGVEQRQLRAGVGAFPAHDHAGATGVASPVNEVGDLGELGSVAQGAVGLDRVDPVHAGGDRGPDRVGDRRADGEEAVHAVFAQAADVGQEPFGGTG